VSKISISGRLTADPQLRFIPSGDAVVSFTVAQNDRKYDKATGQWVDGETLFLKVEGWRMIAEGAAETLRKGDAVVVMGTLKPDNYEKNGEKRYGMKLVADEIGASVRARKTVQKQEEAPAW
jgi:single-strand DNA-binding protein